MLAITGLLTAFMLWSSRLDTRLDADGVRVRFAPIQRDWQFTPWSKIRRAYVRTYAPLREYGGWGIRFSGEKAAYTVWGKQGLQLLLASGDSLLIGTQCPTEITQVLRQLRIAGRQTVVPD